MHWTRRAQARCDANQAELDARTADEPVPPPQMQVVRRIPERDRREFEAEPAARALQEPRNLTEAAVLRNAERQLTLVEPRWLPALDMLMTKDIYRINRNLRQRVSLHDVPVGPVLDSNGYPSVDALLDQATSLFANLGDALSLDEPLTVHRGIKVTELDYGDQDIWQIQALLRGEIAALQDELEDPGFIFTTPFEEEASLHAGHANEDAACWRILFEMTVQRGLCLPDQDISSDEHLRRVQPHFYLRGATSQIVVPRGSRWRVRCATLDSEDEGLMRIQLDQVESHI